jgi:hypothetical protein
MILPPSEASGKRAFVQPVTLVPGGEQDAVEATVHVG